MSKFYITDKLDKLTARQAGDDLSWTMSTYLISNAPGPSEVSNRKILHILIEIA